MENTDTGMDTGSEAVEAIDTGSEGVPTQDIIDVPYDDGYKDDFVVPTQDDPNVAQEPDEEYSDEDMQEVMMDYLRDNYEMPDKFKDVESLINSYKHLEGKMGQMTGAPDTYELQGDVFDNYSEGVLEGVVGQAREMGISNEGLNKLLDTAMKSQNQEADANWAMEKQKMGINGEREMADALGVLNARFSPEVSETVQGMIQTADQFYALRELMNGSAQSVPAASQQTNNGPMSDAKIQEMLFAKDQYGNSKMESDSAYAKKVNGLMKQNW